MNVTKTGVIRFSKQRILTMILIFIFPPLGLSRLWKKETMFDRNEQIAWTIVTLVYVATLSLELLT